jgi:hypothetical protein
MNQGSSIYKTPPDATMNKNRRPPLKIHEKRDILVGVAKGKHRA